MENIKIEVKALIDTDFCKKWDVMMMKEWVYNDYHKNNFEVVEAKKSTEKGEEKKVDEVKEGKIPKKENKAIKNAKNK